MLKTNLIDDLARYDDNLCNLKVKCNQVQGEKFLKNKIIISMIRIMHDYLCFYRISHFELHGATLLVKGEKSEVKIARELSIISAVILR